MEGLADHAQRKAKGAFITIDEFHNANIAALRDFAHALQDIAKIDGKAGHVRGCWPALDGGDRPCRPRHDLLPAHRPKRSWTRSALRSRPKRCGCPSRRPEPQLTMRPWPTAAEATSGYPFMVQLVGYHSWEHCADPTDGITPGDVHAAIEVANHGHGSPSPSPRSFRDLSDTDRMVLEAMSAFDTGEVQICDCLTGHGQGVQLSERLHRAAPRGWCDPPPITGGGCALCMRPCAIGSADRALSGIPMSEQAPSPETTTTVKERIIAASNADPEATHAVIAAQVGTAPDYVGRVRRAHRDSQDTGAGA